MNIPPEVPKHLRYLVCRLSWKDCSFLRETYIDWTITERTEQLRSRCKQLSDDIRDVLNILPEDWLQERTVGYNEIITIADTLLRTGIVPKPSASNEIDERLRRKKSLSQRISILENWENDLSLPLGQRADATDLLKKAYAQENELAAFWKRRSKESEKTKKTEGEGSEEPKVNQNLFHLAGQCSANSSIYDDEEWYSKKFTREIHMNTPVIRIDPDEAMAKQAKDPGLIYLFTHQSNGAVKIGLTRKNADVRMKDYIKKNKLAGVRTPEQ